MANPFTPEQISQILEEFFKVVGTRQYIGARYVPIFGRKGEESIEWDNSAPYEPLTIVLYQGNSYTSRQYVPVGVEITNQEFWALTGNYNAQVEQYRRDVQAFDGRISANADAIAAETTRATGAEKTNADAIAAETTRATGAEKRNSDAIATNAAAITSIESLSTFNVKKYGAKGDGVSDDTAAFTATIEAAISYINKGIVIFDPQHDKVWQANIVIPDGTYNISSILQIDATNGLIQNDNRVCGINIIGIGMPVIRFNDANGFKINGCFFTCKNIEINNAETAFNFSDTINQQPYIEFDNVIIKHSQNGIHFSKGTYVSRLIHVMCIHITNTCFDFGSEGTSLYLSNCYAAGCKIGYKIGTYIYSCLISCACDGAEIAYSIDGASSVQFISCGSENPSKYHYSFTNISHKVCLDNCTVVQNSVTPTALYHFENVTAPIKFNYITYIIQDVKVNFLDGSVAVPPVFNSLDNIEYITPVSTQILQIERKYIYLSGTENKLFIISSATNIYTINLHFVFSNPRSTFYYEANILVTNDGTNYVINKLSENAQVIKPEDISFTFDESTHILSMNGNRLTDMRGYVELNGLSNVYLKSIALDE